MSIDVCLLWVVARDRRAAVARAAMKASPFGEAEAQALQPSRVVEEAAMKASPFGEAEHTAPAGGSDLLPAAMKASPFGEAERMTTGVIAT